MIDKIKDFFKSFFKLLLSKRVICVILSVCAIILLLTLINCFIKAYLSNTKYDTTSNNSFLNSKFIKGKKVMVIVPHQDDEINLAGATIQNFKKAGIDVKIVYATNGDAMNSFSTRYKEAIKAEEILGVNKDDIIFLGYGDVWKTNSKNIYQNPENETLRSVAGKTKTYGYRKHQSFAKQLRGEESKYTRANYVQDFKDVILSNKPDIIIASDLDLHFEHKTTSLLFEEALLEILKSENGYNPLLLKGFAYNTSFYNAEDFYNINLLSVEKPKSEKLNDPKYELDVPQYSWNNRIRFPVSNDVLGYTKRSSVVANSLLAHKSQKLLHRTLSVVNSDQVFWKRRTDNLIYNAKIKASSGDTKYLNDFKLLDTSDISKQHVVYDKCVWSIKKEDKEKKVRIDFNKPTSMSSIHLYDNYSLEDNILKSRLKFSDGTSINVPALNITGEKTVVDFPIKHDITYIEYIVDEYAGNSPGLCEIEVFKNTENTDMEYIKLAENNDNSTFIYNYTITDKNKIPLKLYSYPSNTLDNLDKCKLFIKTSSNDNIRLDNENITISDLSIPSKAIIRAELLEDSSIYDEIEIEIKPKYKIEDINNKVKLEKEYDKLLNMLDSFSNKVDRLYKKVLTKLNIGN